MFRLDVFGPEWTVVLVLAALVGVIAAIRYLTRTTPISSVHAGKQDTHKFKFDPAKVKIRSLLGAPKIDTTNLPAVDPLVVPLLQAVTVANVEQAIKDISGEVDVTVGGVTSKIVSRSSHSKGLETAMAYLEAFYKRHGVANKRYKYAKRGKTLYNLEATILGTVDPDRVIVVGCHLDSTAGDTGRAESRAPGADDDASGTVAVMEAVKALLAFQAAGGVIPYTIRFLHFTGEEQGLWGSYTYSDLVAQAKTDVIAMFQMDMIGYCVKPGNRLDIHDDVDRNGSHSLVVQLVRTAKRYSLNLNIVDTHDKALTDRSDHAGFLDHGYKAVLLSEEFTETGFNKFYHSVDDRLKNMNIPYMIEVVRLLIAVLTDATNIK